MHRKRNGEGGPKVVNRDFYQVYFCFFLQSSICNAPASKYKVEYHDPYWNSAITMLLANYSLNARR